MFTFFSLSRCWLICWSVVLRYVCYWWWLCVCVCLGNMVLSCYVLIWWLYHMHCMHLETKGGKWDLHWCLSQHEPMVLERCHIWFLKLMFPKTRKGLSLAFELRRRTMTIRDWSFSLCSYLLEELPFHSIFLVFIFIKDLFSLFLISIVGFSPCCTGTGFGFCHYSFVWTFCMILLF